MVAVDGDDDDDDDDDDDRKKNNRIHKVVGEITMGRSLAMAKR